MSTADSQQWKGLDSDSDSSGDDTGSSSSVSLGEESDAESVQLVTTAADDVGPDDEANVTGPPSDMPTQFVEYKFPTGGPTTLSGFTVVCKGDACESLATVSIPQNSVVKDTKGDVYRALLVAGVFHVVLDLKIEKRMFDSQIGDPKLRRKIRSVKNATMCLAMNAETGTPVDIKSIAGLGALFGEFPTFIMSTHLAKQFLAAAKSLKRKQLVVPIDLPPAIRRKKSRMRAPPDVRPTTPTEKPGTTACKETLLDFIKGKLTTEGAEASQLVLSFEISARLKPV